MIIMIAMVIMVTMLIAMDKPRMFIIHMSTDIFYYLSQKHDALSRHWILKRYLLKSTEFNLISKWLIRHMNFFFLLHVILKFWNSDQIVIGDQTSEGHCYLYAIIREKAAGVTLNICASKERKSQLYTTSTSSIEISIINEGIGEAHPRFLLEFQGTR